MTRYNRRQLHKAGLRATRPKCWEPNKIRYPTLHQARQAAHRIEHDVRPYLCGDHYHLTSRQTTRRAPK